MIAKMMFQTLSSVPGIYEDRLHELYRFQNIVMAGKLASARTFE
jgi:hypothetical protein